jgi:hypothetical protein
MSVTSCDAGTVANVKVVHRALANPTRLPEILPLEPDENEDRTAGQDEAFFAHGVTCMGSHLR